MKTLNTKKLFAAICHNSLKEIPPRSFETTEDMEKSLVILEAIKPSIEVFIESTKKSEELNLKIATGALSGDDAKKAQQSFITIAKKLESTEGEKKVSIEFENDEFNTFFQFFEKWGKNWFNTVGDYLAFRRDLNDTNQQPKEVKKGKK